MPPKTRHQEIFEKLEELKAKKRDAVRDRKESLNQIPAYVDLTEEIGKLKENRKRHELSFDQENPELADSIDSIKLQIETTTFSLTTALLEAYKKGDGIQLFKRGKGGKLKKIGVEFGAKFKQLSLFD